MPRPGDHLYHLIRFDRFFLNYPAETRFNKMKTNGLLLVLTNKLVILCDKKKSNTLSYQGLRQIKNRKILPITSQILRVTLTDTDCRNIFFAL